MIMSYSIYSVFFFISFVYGVFGQNSYLEEYCWREYAGIIPHDALAGGLDRNGRPMYIGQVLHENKLVPGKIYVNDSYVHYAWDNEKTSDRHVKILCTPHPEKFKWVKSDKKNLYLLTNTILIEGGFEPGYSVYIGRIFKDGETTVGKVVCGEKECLGLLIASNGAQLGFEDFEVLSYSPLSPESPLDSADNPILDIFYVKSSSTANIE